MSAEATPLTEARFEIAQKMSDHFDQADRYEDDGMHIAFSRHHRAVAGGLSEALLILDRISAELEGDKP